MEAIASAKYLKRVGAEGAARDRHDSRQERERGAGDPAVHEQARGRPDREVPALGDRQRDREGRAGRTSPSIRTISGSRRAFVDMGPTKNRRRVRPAPQGRAYREQRHYCHVTILVSSDEQAEDGADAKGKGKSAQGREGGCAQDAGSQGAARRGAKKAAAPMRGAAKKAATERARRSGSRRRPRKPHREESATQEQDGDLS